MVSRATPLGRNERCFRACCVGWRVCPEPGRRQNACVVVLAQTLGLAIRPREGCSNPSGTGTTSRVSPPALYNWLRNGRHARRIPRSKRRRCAGRNARQSRPQVGPQRAAPGRRNADCNAGCTRCALPTHLRRPLPGGKGKARQTVTVPTIEGAPVEGQPPAPTKRRGQRQKGDHKRAPDSPTPEPTAAPAAVAGAGAQI